VRLIPEIEANEDADLYNAGVAFKNRGMWYMAMKAWEGAAMKRPRDTNYRHALGLAYAQLNQFDQAIATLREALAITPNDIKIQESLSLVEKQAARKR
jgi:tetratricopeptide (TPR) repeat protein